MLQREFPGDTHLPSLTNVGNQSPYPLERAPAPCVFVVFKRSGWSGI